MATLFPQENPKETPNPVWLYTEDLGKTMIKHFSPAVDNTHCCLERNSLC